MTELDLKALCEGADVTPRTVHFYIQQGLLPPAGTTGPAARYSEGHLWRLRLIRLLQKEHLPLAEIGRRLRGLDDRQVKGLLDERRGRRTPAKGSALEYIRGVLAKGRDREAGGPSPAADRALMFAARTSDHGAPPEPSLARSQWERIDIADGLELHVRRPTTREQQRQLERLLVAARGIFAAGG